MSTSRKVFVNLPVKSLKRSVDFFGALGFTFDPRFTDAHATCMVLSDEGFVMLLERPRFEGFTKKPVADAAEVTEVIVALSCASRAEVDALVHEALAAGGSPALDPMDMGFMYGWSFYDPDGHHWEVFHMDPGAVS